MLAFEVNLSETGTYSAICDSSGGSFSGVLTVCKKKIKKMCKFKEKFAESDYEKKYYITYLAHFSSDFVLDSQLLHKNSAKMKTPSCLRPISVTLNAKILQENIHCYYRLVYGKEQDGRHPTRTLSIFQSSPFYYFIS